MSKKKASMSLKDFHGGSIPSDFSLPSAPGVFVRSTDLSGYDRPSSRVGSMNRPDQWVRPNSSPAARRFDDKTPFLGPTVPIGRHFDEDERKPLDGSPVPRRTVSDDSFRLPPSREELKPEPALSGRVSGSAVRTHSVNSYSGRVVEGTNVGLSLQSAAGSAGYMRSPVNAWGARKDSVVSVDESMQSSLSGGSVVSKLAHASALEKVSSGRWQTKQSFPYQSDAEVTDHAEAGKIVGSWADDEQKYHRMGVAAGKDSDAMLARQLERGVAIGDGKKVHRKEFSDHDRAKASSYGQLKERNPLVHQDKVQSSHIDGRLGGSVVHPPVQSEALERPKLKLLPRTKPLESLETTISDQKEGSTGQNDTSHGHLVTTQEIHRNVKPSIAGVESEDQVIERPKLNLRPRSQPVDQSEANNEKERVALFCGARPRELVLKERGIDDSAFNNHQDISQQSHRVRHNVPKDERVAQNTIASHQGEKADNPNPNTRIGKKLERKDQPDIERADLQRKNWRNENWRNSRETERQNQLQQLQLERQLSPESWRKPVEQQKPVTHYGKTASALELAQAFSRSISDPKAADPYSGHKVPPGKTQMPFSRLMGPTPRPQINGY